MRRWYRAVRHRVGYRGAALLFFAELDLVYAWVLAFPTPEVRTSATNQYFATLLPLHAWAMLWAVVGALCLYHAFVRYDRLGFIAAVLLKVIWGGFALLGNWFADVPASSPAIWISLAGLVWVLSGWREPGLSTEDAEHADES